MLFSGSAEGLGSGNTLLAASPSPGAFTGVGIFSSFRKSSRSLRSSSVKRLESSVGGVLVVSLFAEGSSAGVVVPSPGVVSSPAAGVSARNSSSPSKSSVSSSGMVAVSSFGGFKVSEVIPFPARAISPSVFGGGTGVLFSTEGV